MISSLGKGGLSPLSPAVPHPRRGHVLPAALFLFSWVFFSLWTPQIPSVVPRVLSPDRAQAVVRDTFAALLGCREDAPKKGVFIGFFIA